MAFYSRIIKLEGVSYKQISFDAWQNLITGEIIDSTRMSLIINQYKKEKKITPSQGPLGACCEVVNGVMQCTVKPQEACSGGCFKGEGTNCLGTTENPNPCSASCVHCCFVGSGCFARTPSSCLAAGGTYFAFGQGCTSCKFGVCSSDPVTVERFYGSGCSGIFIEGGGPASFDEGVFCTGSGLGQTCFGPGQQYEALTSIFISGGTCSDCILGSCCTGGTCAGITSQSACSALNGLFFAGQSCGLCDFGVFCTGAGTDRTCIRTGYRGEALSNEFQQGATCSFCQMGMCCVNGEPTITRQSQCNGNFFANIFDVNACNKGSCCVGATCSENVFRYDCAGVFNQGLTCIACGNGACCLPGGGCTLTAMGTCMATGGTFFGGQTCSACDNGVCCNNNICTPNQRRGDVCAGTFYAGIDCSSTPCEKGACCTGATCISNTESINCFNISGRFFSGVTCIACVTGANCLSEFESNGDRTCVSNEFFGAVIDGTFYQNQGCSACKSGACCNPLGGGGIGIRGDCTGISTFYAGQTLYICDAGVFCTGSGLGQTCFGLGYRGQSLTNNFIAGATCNSCILGSCCTGGTCLGGGLTSQAACSSAGGLFFAGRTCTVCDYGVYCTGATCLSLGYRGQSLSNNFIIGATCSSCVLGACCTGGTCSGGGQTSQAACSGLNGLFYAGATCGSCDYGVYCQGATCFELGYRAQALTNNFIQGATCNSCILGACCTGGTCLGGGQTSQAACLIAGGTFYAGATCFQCATGVFCTGSGLGQTCFGLGHRGQSLTNNFIAGATCNSCILGSCCTGGTCYGGTLTSEATCNSVGGLFFVGTTCISCDFGVFCTGANENKNCLQNSAYRAQNLSNEFITGGACRDCNFGACCQGASCLGITSEKACGDVGGDFIDGATCSACSGATGICCTGSGYIDTPENCAIAGGHWFPSGTTALCVTGSCCTGGTCIEEIVGKSGNCQLFIAGSTCGICDTGVYCTGATCLQLGFRGQSLATVFIVGETCSSCIQGICCKDDYLYTQIAGGKEHSVALTTYGEVRGFGGNTYGQSGMTLALGYTGIAAGFYHTLAISNGGTVMAWGRNQYGQSTVPAGLTGVVQVAAGEYHSIALRSNGGVTCWGWNGQAQCNVPSGLTGVTMISAGGGHNLALKQDGTVVAWGYNYDGQTNVPAGLTGVIQVAAGYHHSLALLTGGGITCWGMTLYGQCNIPAGLTASKIAAGGYHTLVLKADGGVTAFGRTGYDQTLVPSGLNAKQIAGGEFHSLAINSANTVVTWGSNIYGETNVTSDTCESFNQKQCESKFGSFNPGATQCSVCDIRVNCCVNGQHSYVLADTCISNGGIIFEGEEDLLACETVAFCEGITCAGVTLLGFSLSPEFRLSGDCRDCIKGTCCSEEGTPSLTTQNQCNGNFTPGEYDPNICFGGVTLGICCNGETCSSNINESDCQTGYFLSNEIAFQNNISCQTNPCQVGVCCKESAVTSVTGGVCLGVMTRAECSLTGGDFFASSEGYTCSNCLYIPMLASAVFERFASAIGQGVRRTDTFLGSQTGFTGNEIQPVNAAASDNDNWISNRGNFYGANATTSNISLYRSSNLGSLKSQTIEQSYRAFNQFRLWYNPGVTLHFQSNTPFGITNGTYDAPPDFSLGLISANGFSLGYILGNNNTDVYQVPRYLRVVLGYGNPDDNWYGTSLVYRWVGVTNGDPLYAMDDATLHAGLTLLHPRNTFPNPSPYITTSGGTPGISYSSPVLVQVFAENPLKHRVRRVGSCCKGVTCIGIITEDHCAFTGGTFYENSQCNACYPNLLVGNCCTGGTFYGFTNEAACNSIGGYFKRGRQEDRSVCIYGSECSSTETCIAGNTYFGSFIGASGSTFVRFNYEDNLGCSACDRGICCVGPTCNGYIPRITCAGLSGIFYENDTSCVDMCSFGVCCDLNSNGCGVYTNKASCKKIDDVFFEGYTAGQTCSACSSLYSFSAFSSGVTYIYTMNQGVTHGTFFDGSAWVQEKEGTAVRKIRMEYDDAEQTSYAEIAAGKNHSVALTNYDGIVFGFGDNTYGQCGITLNEIYRKVSNSSGTGLYLGKGYTGIGAGFYHTLAITNGGTVMAWGRNDDGQCNVPAGLLNVKQVAGGERHSIALTINGGVTCWGYNGNGQCDVPEGLTGVIMISAGAAHNLALKQDGTVSAWGDNTYGQTTVPVGATGVTYIAAGYYHSVAAIQRGVTVTPIGWGRNNFNQCVFPAANVINRVTKVAAGGYHSLLIDRGSGYAFGRTLENQVRVRPLNNPSPFEVEVREIAAGEYNTLAIKSPQRTVSTRGSNSNNQSDFRVKSVYSANTKISNLQLTNQGYIGSVYIHGVQKNPMPWSYIDKDYGYTKNNEQPYTSINYSEYGETNSQLAGWFGPYQSNSTDIASNYSGFDLNMFNTNKDTLSSTGFTLNAGDVLFVETTNFNPQNKVFPGSAGGYPYQVTPSRANTLVFGLLNCLSATGASLAGSTLCFRPPCSWPPEKRQNKPIYPISVMNGKIPGQPGNTLITLTTTDMDEDVTYATSKEKLTSYVQTSEFGNAVEYGVISPYWSMFGYKAVGFNSYGEQYIFPLNDMIQCIFATGSDKTSIMTIDQRKDLLARVVQYGLDAFGAQKVFAMCLSSGAGQKAARTRGWIPLAGYYLGVTGMYDPENSMLVEEPERTNKLIEYSYRPELTKVVGPLPGGTCISDAQWNKFRFGDTGAENNFQGIRRFIGRMMAHEVNTMIEVVNDPSNLLRHYEYPGSYYNETSFTGFGFNVNGATGIKFYNAYTTRKIVCLYNDDPTGVPVEGNFGIIQIGMTGYDQIPFGNRFSYDKKEGSGGAFAGGWIRVVSGAGSCGGNGSRYYKVLYSTGFRNDTKVPANRSVPTHKPLDVNSGFYIQDTSPTGGGYQIVLGQTWADGVPDETSVVKFYAISPIDAGITRPSSFHPLGYTYGPVFYSINNNPDTNCGQIPNYNADSVLWDANLGTNVDYYTNSFDAWMYQYALSDYISRTKGVSLISDIAPMPDYIKQYIYTSPYNIISLYAFVRNTTTVFKQWLGITWTDSQFQKQQINFTDHFPGIVKWNGITV